MTTTSRRRSGVWSFVLLLPVWLCAAALAAAQAPAVEVDDDEITIRGCVGRADAGVPHAQPVLVWTHGDIMLSNAMAVRAGQPRSLPERVFYWLEDEEDLAKHVGQSIEVEGTLDEFETGEIEIERDGAFTEIELELGGKTETARVPTTWLGEPRDEGTFEIVARRIQVDEIEILGACQAR